MKLEELKIELGWIVHNAALFIKISYPLCIYITFSKSSEQKKNKIILLNYNLN